MTAHHSGLRAGAGATTLDLRPWRASSPVPHRQGLTGATLALATYRHAHKSSARCVPVGWWVGKCYPRVRALSKKWTQARVCGQRRAVGPVHS